ncbi:thioesterase family protein [Ramlibacter solisilvae]|uniref:Acyl-CoA thioesterase n=2 Tax=Ramlibacter tataouinensis TaxID=94132 RepID=A0A127JV48_9BURK|nr:acyl-CoA thioesterase [Ramlibacter tataouinensis]
MNTHPFDNAIALAATGQDGWEGRTSPDYANFIGPYGGIMAAQALNAVMLHPQRLGEPVAFTVNFAAAMADGPFEARARPARTNRSTQHWIVELLQDGQAVVTATALTAIRRETWSGDEAVMPAARAPQELAPPTQPARVAWLGRYDMRFIGGSVPYPWDGQDRGHSRTALWVRDNPSRALDFPSLTSMADIFFPRVWLRRGKPSVVGTVTMTVYFHADGAQLQAAGAGYLLAQAQGQGFRNGYFDHAGHLWSEAGVLLATTHQLVYFKE